MLYLLYSAKNATDVLQVVNFANLSRSCQQVATSLSISSSWNKPVELIRLVAACQLQTCYNLLEQVAPSLLISHLDNQRASSLLITCKTCRQQTVASHANAPDVQSWPKLCGHQLAQGLFTYKSHLHSPQTMLMS